MAVQVLILRAPGTNCDVETAFAFEKAGAKATVLHLNRLLENEKILADYQILCLPGGFSFGDDVGSGKVFAAAFRHRLADALQAFKSRDTLILGICNGFQTLLKSGLLLAEDAHGAQATLAWNNSGMYCDKWVELETYLPPERYALNSYNSPCVFLRGLEKFTLPIAHAEGRFVARDEETLQQLEACGCLALRYDGENPNGAQKNVAGVCDESGRVFGLMPHPERFIDVTQHPRWTRGGIKHSDGFAIFQNAVEYFQ